MTQAFVSVGSNINPRVHMRAAIRALAMQTDVVAISTVYRTEPEGPPGQPFFYNCVVEIRTNTGPHALKTRVLRRIEADLGRRRTSDKYAPRTIDLDLILYDNLILETGDLTIPDPQIEQKPFLAVPLSDLSPGLMLPGGTARIAELAARLPSDTLRPLAAYTGRLRADLKDAFHAGLQKATITGQGRSSLRAKARRNSTNEQLSRWRHWLHPRHVM